MNKKTIILIGCLTLLLLGGVYFLYMYNKPHRQVAKEQPSYTLYADDLFKQYSTDEAQANDLYLDKVILVNGRVKDISKDSVNLMTIILETDDEIFGVNCIVSNVSGQTKELKEGDSVKIKGLCTGMLSDVVLINCSIED